MERASTVAGELLAGTGVTVIWEKGSPDFPEAQITDMSAGWSRTARDTREYLVVRIVRGIPAQVYPSATGYSLPFARAGANGSE